MLREPSQNSIITVVYTAIHWCVVMISNESIFLTIIVRVCLQGWKINSIEWNWYVVCIPKQLYDQVGSISICLWTLIDHLFIHERFHSFIHSFFIHSFIHFYSINWLIDWWMGWFMMNGLIDWLIDLLIDWLIIIDCHWFYILVWGWRRVYTYLHCPSQGKQENDWISSWAGNETRV